MFLQEILGIFFIKQVQLVTGPPGIGKSTAVNLITQALGLTVVGTNASEQRNAAAVQTFGKALVTNSILSKGVATKKFIIVMDEVDGMTGSDRGGIKTLIEQIKKTKIPIICICNDGDQ